MEPFSATRAVTTTMLVALIALGGKVQAEVSGVEVGKPQSAAQQGVGTGGPQDMAPAPGESSVPAEAKETGAEKLTEEQQAKDRQLRERVRKRWDTVIERDFKKAYEFEAPEFRKEHTAEEYAGMFGPMIRWNVATVKQVRYDRPDEAEVIIDLDYSFPLGGEMIRTKGIVTEQWVFLDSTWWRRHVQPTLGGVEQPDPSGRK